MFIVTRLCVWCSFSDTHCLLLSLSWECEVAFGCSREEHCRSKHDILWLYWYCSVWLRGGRVCVIRMQKSCKFLSEGKCCYNDELLKKSGSRYAVSWCSHRRDSACSFWTVASAELCIHQTVTRKFYSSFLTRSIKLIFSILLQHHISKLSRYFWSTVRRVQVLVPYKR